MTNTFSVTTNTSYGSRIVNSIKGIIFGFLLFAASFVVLYMNEGRVNLANIATKAVVIEAATPHPELESSLVALSAAVQTNNRVSDGLYLKPGAYLLVNRNVEMYAWVEHKQAHTQKNTGGSETTTATYTYTEEWTTSPGNDFQQSQDHENPPMPLRSTSTRATSAKIGLYDLDVSSIDLPSPSNLALHDENLMLREGVTLQNDYLFQGKGTISQPQVGDIRISYAMLPSGLSATVIGRLSGNSIQPYADQDGNHLYRVFAASSKGEAVSMLQHEYSLWLWILRGIGFLMMWIGLCLMLAPLSVLLDVLPILGSVTGAVIGLITFVVALALSIVTIIVSVLAHSLLALAITMFLSLIIGGVFFLKYRR